jgi:hypothetical protein
MGSRLMMWYAVHALHYFEYKEGEQSDYLVWEHVYLIRAESFDKARERGELRAKQDETDSAGSLTVNDRLARLRFAAIRKVVECQDLDLRSGQPTDGTELSYSEFKASNSAEFAKLTTGESAAVLYLGKEAE